VPPLITARRVRPGTYRVRSARKFLFLLVAVLEDAETSQAYGLKMDGFDESGEAKLTLNPMRSR
jgi:hypothetical protein